MFTSSKTLRLLVSDARFVELFADYVTDLALKIDSHFHDDDSYILDNKRTLKSPVTWSVP